MWFVGHDFSDASIAAKENTKPDMEIVTRVMGVEVGYLITPIIIFRVQPTATTFQMFI